MIFIASMKTLNPKNTICVKSLKLLGDFWTLRIIDSLKDGSLRFCEVQRSVDNLNPVTLTDRLQKLEKAGLVNRDQDPNNKMSVSYSLTRSGIAALPVLEAITAFSKVSK